ncbi:MAG: hypothetical protein U1F11_07045 [Steroidobacteraceae bacterium]
MCFRGIHAPAGQQQPHGDRARQAQREALRAATESHRADAWFAHREARLVRRDHDVAAQGDLEAAAVGHAIDGRDQRLAQRRARRETGPACRRHRFVRCIGEIVAGAEGPLPAPV